MYVVDVLPLAKGVRAESLTYFSPEQIPSGTLVTAPMRNRKISAIVSKCTPAQDMKAELKQMPYEMKPIDAVGKQIFFAQFIVACRSFARFSGVTTGAVIKALTPAEIIDNNEELPGLSSDIFLPEITAPKPRIIQNTNKKQYGYINSLIQSRISANETVFVCVPTNHQARIMAEKIDSTATIIRLDSTLTKTDSLSRWREAVTTTNPVVIVGTAPFLSVPRADLGLIVVVDEINDAYKMIQRPHLDKRLFARHLAREYKRDCVLAGNILSTETLWEYRNNKIENAYKPVFHYDGPVGELVDMRDLKETKKDGVRIFSPPVAEAIRKTMKESKKLLLFVARRGRRPFTVCNDCGETVSCERCGYPMVLLENSDGERTFICKTCKRKETSLRRCQTCSSWNLKALGVGIDFVADVLAKNAPDLDVYQIDSQKTSTEKQLEKTLDDFAAADNGVLLTTQLGVNRLQDEVNMSAVITADSLLALPDLSITEKLFSLLLSIREQTRETFIIQTRSQHTEVFTQALAGDVTDFYRQQIAQREQFSYPPFSYLIKLTSRGKPETVKKNLKKAKQLFTDKNLKMYPGSGGRDFVAHALLSIPTDEWPDAEVLEKLHSLPLAIDINAHPRSLL